MVMEMFFLITLSLLTSALFYLFYQLVRNEAVFKIRNRWVLSSDKRWYKYTYREMFDPSKSNWYGLKFPRENDYK